MVFLEFWFDQNLNPNISGRFLLFSLLDLGAEGFLTYPGWIKGRGRAVCLTAVVSRIPSLVLCILRNKVTSWQEERHPDASSQGLASRHSLGEAVPAFLWQRQPAVLSSFQPLGHKGNFLKIETFEESVCCLCESLFVLNSNFTS